MVGRICCDSEGRLNERSILLEGSVELSNGMRTKLDLSKLDSFKLFPGQVSIALPAAIVQDAFVSCIRFELL